MPDDEPFIQITHGEVWQELRRHESAESGGGHYDHESRLRKLELRYYALLAGLVAGTVSATTIILRS